MKNLSVIEGQIRNLKVVDSKIHPLQNLEEQALVASAIGAVTSNASLSANAPIMLMAANGISAKTFTAEVNGVSIIGQFTTVAFKNKASLIIVISNKKSSGRYLAYAVLDPKQGLLYMIYEMGMSISQARKSRFVIALTIGIFSFIFIVVIIFLSIFFSENKIFETYTELSKILIIAFIISNTMSFLVFYIAMSKSSNLAAKWSEAIFTVLNFEHVEKQNFSNDFLSTPGVYVSVMEYRKNLKGRDPYPEDYFDKKLDESSISK